MTCFKNEALIILINHLIPGSSDVLLHVITQIHSFAIPSFIFSIQESWP